MSEEEENTKKSGKKKLSNVFSGWEVNEVINVWKMSQYIFW